MSKRIVALLASAALLGSCGEGGGSSSGNGPIGGTPTPSPSPAPSPSPSPTPTYPTYASLTGDQNFKTACAGFWFTGSMPAILPATEFGNGAGLAYTAASQSYTLSLEGANVTFGPADIDPSVPAGAPVYKKVFPNGTDRLSFSGSPLNGVTLDYTRSFQWFTTQVPLSSPRQVFCVFGVPTLVTDVPAATSVTFTKVGLIGIAYYNGTGPGSIYSLSHSIATFTVDLTTGKVDSALTLIGTPSGGGTDVTIATIQGSGDIDPTTGGFYGQWTTSSRNAVGNFGGRFFGPQGKEVAYATSIIGNTGGVQDLSVSAAVFGSR